MREAFDPPHRVISSRDPGIGVAAIAVAEVVDVWSWGRGEWPLRCG